MASTVVTAAIAGAVAGPAGSAIVEGISSIGSLFNTGSPRYQGGPLVSSVLNRLEALRAGDQTAIAQTRSDAVSGGPGWRDAALVLAPAMRPDLFGTPSRPLTAEEQGYIAQAGGTTTATTPAGSTAGAPGGAPALPPTMQAAVSKMPGGLLGWVLVGGIVVLGVIAFVLDRKK